MIAPPARFSQTALAAQADDGLSTCDALLAHHLDAVRRNFGPAALGVIDLPQLGTTRLVGEQIRVCAVLYWASEIERAGLLAFIEAVAEGVMRGSVVEPLGSVIPELTRFWRSREHRFMAPEREALFTRLFGHDAGPAQYGAFEDQFRSLVNALVAIGRSPLNQQTTHLEARLAVTAQQVGATLTQHGTGIAGFAARDIVAQIRLAFRLLEHSDLARALGGGSPWQLVTRHAPRLLGREVVPERHVGRAIAGLRIIAWLASEASAIESGALRVSRSAPVIGEAETWSAASGAA